MIRITGEQSIFLYMIILLHYSNKHESQCAVQHQEQPKNNRELHHWFFGSIQFSFFFMWCSCRAQTAVGLLGLPWAVSLKKIKSQWDKKEKILFIFIKQASYPFIMMTLIGLFVCDAKKRENSIHTYTNETFEKEERHERVCGVVPSRFAMSTKKFC